MYVCMYIYMYGAIYTCTPGSVSSLCRSAIATDDGATSLPLLLQ